MGYRTDYFSILQDGTAMTLDNAAGGVKKPLIGDMDDETLLVSSWFMSILVISASYSFLLHYLHHTEWKPDRSVLPVCSRFSSGGGKLAENHFEKLSAKSQKEVFGLVKSFSEALTVSSEAEAAAWSSVILLPELLVKLP